MSRLTKHIELDRRYVKVCTYASVTVLLTLAVCMVLYTASPVFYTVWQLFCSVIEPLVYGAALSYVLNPLVKWVSSILIHRKRYANDPAKRRSASVVFSLVLVAIALLILIGLLLVMVTHSLASLNWASIQELLGSSREDFMGMLRTIEEKLEQWGILSSERGDSLLEAFNNVKNVASTALFAVIFAVYFLIDGRFITTYLGRVARAALGSYSIDPSRALADADHVFSGYFRGQGIDAAIVCVLSGVLLTAVGVPYAPLIGVLSGLGNLIPYLGGPVGFGSVALMCIPDEQWDKLVLGLIVMAIVMFVDGNIINPRLLSTNVEVHPALVLVALIAGGAVGGIAGMLVAVPTVAWLKIQVDRWLEWREASLEVAERDEMLQEDE